MFRYVPDVSARSAASRRREQVPRRTLRQGTRRKSSDVSPFRFGIVRFLRFSMPKGLARARVVNRAKKAGVSPGYPSTFEEKAMALFDRFKTQAGTPVPTTGEYVPAESQSMTGWKGQANAVLGRATQVYKQNPKLIGGLALLGLAGMLVRMKQGR